MSQLPPPVDAARLEGVGIEGIEPGNLAAAGGARQDEAVAGSRRGRGIRLGSPLGPSGLAGLVLVGLVVLLGLLAPLLTPWDPIHQIPSAQLLAPSAQHPLGTDNLGRDLFARVLFGIRTSLLVCVISVPLGAVLGITLGILAPSFRVLDVVLQRVFDVALSFPALILAMLLALVLGPGLWTVVVVIVISETPVVGRLVRSQVVRVRALPYVESAEVIGAGRLWVMGRHILPNVLEPVVVHIPLAVSGAIFAESAMGFLGVGVRPPMPSLGAVISSSLLYLEIRPLFVLGPLLVILALSLGLYLISLALGRGRRG